MLCVVSKLPRLAYLTALYPAASHTFILREVTALRALGFEVETCSIRRPPGAHLIGPQEREAEASTFYTIETGKNPAEMLRAILAGLTHPRRLARALGLAVRTSVPGLKGTLKQIAYVAEALILARHLRKRGVAHMHNHFAGPSATVCMLTSALSGIPYSYTLHGPTDFYEPEKWHLRTKTAHAQFVTCISHFARGQGMFFSDPEAWKKLHIVHCGVRPQIYDLPAPPRTDERIRLLFVGRLAAVKGLRVLLEAFAMAHRTHPNLHLTLIGDGDDRAHLEQAAAPLGDAVTFAGYQSQDGVAAALAATDIFVLPSFAEGLPVVLMEALAAARPVICTQVAGVGDLVEEGVNGFLVQASDTHALAERIVRLADDPELRTAMGVQGRAKVQSDFNIDIEAARIGALFAGTAGTDVRPAPLTPTS